MSTTYDHYKGKIILIARLQSKPGKGDELQRYLMNIHAFSNSEEPGCLTFRVTRAKIESTNEDKFAIFEEYVDQNAVAEHFKGQQFNALVNAVPELAIAGPTLEYFQECPSN